MSTADSPARTPLRLLPPPRILAITAPYYRQVVEGMLAAARTVFEESGATMDVAEVAGGFELPAALAMALRHTERWEGFLLLGCIVRGETDHYHFISQAICQGVMDLAVRQAAAIGFGLLTVDHLAQAEARSRNDRFNKGAEAAHAVLGQIALARRLRAKPCPTE